MLINILTHTPLYVWAILALLVYRGVIAMRDRETNIKLLFVIPVVMLVLSLQDVMTKFGVHTLPLVAWNIGAAAMMLLVFNVGQARIEPGSAMGRVRVRGSAIPFAMMMAIFVTKYVLAVALVMQPQWRTDALVAAGVCVLLGTLCGYFLGRLARDVMTFRAFPATPATGAAVLN